jgi:flagellar biosynthesis/type III secretory pathway chaperone
VSPSPISPDPLDALLGEELAALGTLLSLLGEEEQALVTGDALAIGAIVLAKGRQLDTLGAVMSRRVAFCQSIGLNDAGSAAVNQTHSTHAADSRRTRTLWSELRGAWHDARRRNSINAEVVNLRLSRTARALNVVRQLRGDMNSYRADGRLAGYYLSA